MTKEQGKPSELMSPAEQGKATFQLQTDFFAGERKLESYLDSLHSWRIGNLYPTNFGSPRGVMKHVIDGKTFIVQIGVHHTGPDTATLSSLERTLKVHIVENVLNGANRAATKRTTVHLNAGYLAKIKSNDVVEHTSGKVKAFQNGKPMELDEADPETYEKIREWLSPSLTLELKLKNMMRTILIRNLESLNIQVLTYVF